MRLLAFAALALALGCIPVTGIGDSPTTVDATVEFIELEGGCWSIKTAEDVFEPINLPAQFRQDGLNVRVRMKRRDGLAGTCMIGPFVEILSIQER